MKFYLSLTLLCFITACGQQPNGSVNGPSAEEIATASADNEPNTLGVALGFQFGSYTYAKIQALKREGNVYTSTFALSEDPYRSKLVEVFYEVPRRLKSPDLSKLRVQVGCGVVDGTIPDLQPADTANITIQSNSGSPVLHADVKNIISLLSTCHPSDAIMIFEHYNASMTRVEAKIVLGITLKPEVSRY